MKFAHVPRTAGRVYLIIFGEAAIRAALSRGESGAPGVTGSDDAPAAINIVQYY